MDIKPRYNTKTLNIRMQSLPKTLKNSVKVDPQGIISSGIYKVIRWEKIRQSISFFTSTLLMLVSLIMIIVYATALKGTWTSFLIPSAVFLFSTYRSIITFMESKWLRNSIIKYREDLKIGINHTPPFINRLYVKMHKKQIGHNWLTFFLMFNIGILTLMLWGLKDRSWWIFEFDKWIKALFINPTLMIWIFTISLIVIVVVHMIMAIQRRKRILDINAYFGNDLVPQSEIETIKSSKNKQYRRLFIIYLMIMAVIPMTIKIILKIFRRK